MTDRPRLMGQGEIQRRLGVSRQRVNQLTHELDFPLPFATLIMGRVWLAADVEEWIRRRPRRGVTPADAEHEDTATIPGEWTPADADITVPNTARMHDYALGGIHNLATDRDAWHQVEDVLPDARMAARANREFLGRAVRWLAAEQGISQFLDLGSGIPTLGHVHEAAQQIRPDARVVYVDIDPVTVEHSRILLHDNPRAQVIRGDLRDPAIMFDERIADLIDLSQPVAVLMIAVLDLVPDHADPRSIIARIGEAVIPGSILVLSHTGPQTSLQSRQQQEAQKTYERTPTPPVIRDQAQLLALIDDSFEVLPPGVIIADQWHPDPDQAAEIPPQPTVLVAVARRR